MIPLLTDKASGFLFLLCVGVSSWKVGRMFVHDCVISTDWEKFVERLDVMTTASLTPEQEREAKQLEAKIRLVIDKEVAALASLLVSKSDKDLFGQTEFQVRDLVLRIGAKGYEGLR